MKKLLTSIIIAMLFTSGCTVGFGKHKDTTFFYARIGDQSISITEEGIKQEAEGKIPSGFFALLSELL